MTQQEALDRGWTKQGPYWWHCMLPNGWMDINGMDPAVGGEGWWFVNRYYQKDAPPEANDTGIAPNVHLGQYPTLEEALLAASRMYL